MTEAGEFTLKNACLCVLPLITIPVAAFTAVLGPCAGIKDTPSGILLFLVSAGGIVSMIAGYVRWERTDTSSDLRKKALKIITCVVGLGAIVVNCFFAFLSGMELFAIL